MRIALLATGGTIAMAPATGEQGARPRHGAAALAATAPGLAGIEILPRDLFAKPSPSLSLADVAILAAAVRQAVAEGLDGVVITHGTDTLEESAFALALLLGASAAPIPVVLTGAMRNAAAIGADGPANLLDALRVAAAPAARGLGPLVVMNGAIHAAHLVHKLHSHRLDAFSSAPFGPIGALCEGRVEIALAPCLPLPTMTPGATVLSAVSAVPAVPIVMAGMDLEPEAIAAFADAPVGGLILAGTGGGHVAARAVPAVAALAARIPVVLTSRLPLGGTLRDSYAFPGSETDLVAHGVIHGGRWRAVQARILLQMALSAGVGRADLPGVFG